MEAVIALRLPRDPASVPVIRKMIDSALGVAGVDKPIRDDIRLMLTEACSNVIIHALTSDEYDVSANVFEDRCVIRVMDAGVGFAAEAARPVPITPTLRPLKSTPSCGHRPEWYHLPLKFFRPLKSGTRGVERLPAAMTQ